MSIWKDLYWRQGLYAKCAGVSPRSLYKTFIIWNKCGFLKCLVTVNMNRILLALKSIISWFSRSGLLLYRLVFLREIVVGSIFHLSSTTSSRQHAPWIYLCTYNDWYSVLSIMPIPSNGFRGTRLTHEAYLVDFAVMSPSDLIRHSHVYLYL